MASQSWWRHTTPVFVSSKVDKEGILETKTESAEANWDEFLETSSAQATRPCSTVRRLPCLRANAHCPVVGGDGCLPFTFPIELARAVTLCDPTFIISSAAMMRAALRRAAPRRATVAFAAVLALALAPRTHGMLTRHSCSSTPRFAPAPGLAVLIPLGRRGP